MATTTTPSSTSPTTMGGSPASAWGAPIPRSSPAHTPPPARGLDLREGETVMGWIDGPTIGFRGFADEHEAAHAAWVAYRTMARRFAREGGHRPPPIDNEPLALGRSGDAETILASGRPIAKLVRPGPGSRSGPEFFGFELEAPAQTDDLTVRSTAHLLYRTLRRSGIRWAMWAPEPQATAADAATEEATTPATAHARAGAARREGASGIAGTALVFLAMLVVVTLPAITTSTVVPVLGTVAGLLALGAVASLVHVVATDVRDALRGRWRPGPGAGRTTRRAPRHEDGRLPAATRVAA